MNETSKRINLWDNIKGVLILLVVFCHCLWQFSDSPLIADFLKYVYFFHMPVFIFVSGYFGTKRTTALNIAKLVFAYFIFNSITGLLYGFSNVLVPVYSYWYILALILWRLTADKVEQMKHPVLVTLGIGLLIGFIPQIDNTLGFTRFLGFYPFYMAGYMYARKHTETNAKEGTQTSQRRTICQRDGLLGLLIGISVSFAAISIMSIEFGQLMMDAYTSPRELFIRVLMYVVGFGYVLAFVGLTTTRKVKFLTCVGRNSLSIFLIHRVITLTFSTRMEGQPTLLIVFASIALTALICAVFGNDMVGQKLNRYLEMGGQILLQCKAYFSKDRKYEWTSISAILVLVCMLLHAILPLVEFPSSNQVEETQEVEQTLQRTMTSDQEQAFQNAYRIEFAGDLILLEDQVKRGRQADGSYRFDDVFEYAKPYIESADFAIGVFEGPMAGAEAKYSEGNFDDGKDLYLNYPREFGEAVRDTGFDLVTTANNHLLDRGFEGVNQTLDTMDEIGLNHTGSYRSSEEKEQNNVYFVEQNGIRFAVLSYTYGTNYHETEELYRGEHAYCTSFISETKDVLLDELKEDVRKDFEKAKAMNPDLIIVLPHYGTQFSNEPDEMQLIWNDVFKEYGADIILGDHAHAIQPVQIETREDGKTVFEAFCPGNFANLFRDYQGDTSALIEVYIDRNTKKVIGGGIVPLYTQAPMDGNYRAIPIYDVVYDDALRATLTTDDYKRAAEANQIITTVAMNTTILIEDVKERYLFDAHGYLRPPTTGLILTDEMRSGTLWPLLEQSSSISFLGDSVTEGTSNGGCPWYEPMLEYLPDKEISNLSKGGCTVSYLIEHSDQIPSSDVYVIAIGTNDVRHLDRSDAASTPEEYVARIRELTEILLQKNSQAKLAFIAPWYSMDGDPITILSYPEKLEMNQAYSTALQEYCEMNQYAFININAELQYIMETELCSTYMIDHIHPNSTDGVLLYSRLVLESSDSPEEEN